MTALSPPHAARSRAATVALTALQILIALAFFGVGGAKLAGVAPMVAVFDAVGVGQWFRYVTGVLEILGGVLLLVPRLAVLGALLLAGVMVGAMTAHRFILHTPLVAPLILLIGLSIVLIVRRAEITDRLARLRR